MSKAALGQPSRVRSCGWRSDHRRSPFGRSLIGSLVLTVVSFSPAWSLDHVVLQRDDETIRLSGRVEVQARDGGMLFRSRNGTLWIIQPDELVELQSDETPFEPTSADEISAELLERLPGFRIHETNHYVIAYDTTTVYAEWCGSLFERLYRAFFNYWENRGMRLDEPEGPLVAIVFGDEASFSRYSEQELGQPIGSIIGYYNMRSNRMIMYDLTGIDALSRGGRRVSSAARINQILSQPGAERTVATIVHEATHQLAYNSGLQVRYADNPFWVSEGLAVYFETPDLQRSRGWSTIGGINRYNLQQFERYLSIREPGSLEGLIGGDERFRDPELAPFAYAEAWALTYFLLKTRERDYIEYLQLLAGQPALAAGGPEERLDHFRSVFGDNLAELEQDFLRYMLRRRR